MRKHIEEPWILLYIERWLKTPFQTKEGEIIPRTAGTPQGGVISPILANLFMHYAFDLWMARTYPRVPFERYADDTVIHCRTEIEAKGVLEALNERMKECKLELHPVKTKIVYCKDTDRRKEYPNTEFDFLGYTFRRVMIKDRLGRLQFNFIASVSRKAEQTLRDKVRAMELHKRTGSKIKMIAETVNPVVRGWMNYFGKYNTSSMKRALDCIQRRLIRWVMCKYKRFQKHRSRAEAWLKELKAREPNMFTHWALCG